ncbi:putative minor capsid protein L2 [Etapapillomavirus 1]|uniref:Putative minor capsid protein L2 n=2 Tax=Fringilla coelebs papillomavirus TaxID=197771 RepID=Q8JNA3_FCPVN|nr:putative minor capsid protein L2 [Etapapillomavirus 1]AAL14230.1 putative minor capsid protein L2 [Etapapillomavirus 1]
MTGNRRYLISLPRQGVIRRVRRTVPVFGRIWTLRPPTSAVIAARRRRRAAEGDLWRDCLAGRNCPVDIYNKYTQNTIADNILKYGSQGVYFGGLSIGTGSGSGSANRGTGLGSGVTVPIPRERPFRLPGSSLPVTVDVSANPPRALPEIPSNTFVNPAFEGSIVSSSGSGSVLVTDVEPVPELYRPLDQGEIFYPGREPPIQLEEYGRRGDVFVASEAEPKQPVPGTHNAPPQGTPFEEIELQMFPYSTRAEADELWVGSDVQFEEWVGMQDVPRTSTPGRETVNAFENPAYEEDIDEMFQEGLRDLGAGLDEVEEVGPSVFTSGEAGVTRSQRVRVLGMTLRSGARIPRILNVIGSLSGISALEPPPIELRVFSAEGTGDVFVAADTGFNGTQPWDLQGGIDTDDIEFEDIDLSDPFPEMEIEDDDTEAVHVGLVNGLQHTPMVVPIKDGHHILTAVRPVPVSPPITPLPPFPSGVDINVTDPSLYWLRWWLRRRRRRGYLLFR